MTETIKLTMKAIRGSLRRLVRFLRYWKREGHFINWAGKRCACRVIGIPKDSPINDEPLTVIYVKPETGGMEVEGEIEAAIFKPNGEERDRPQ